LNFAVEVKGLHKTFVSGFFRRRKKEALKGVDLRVPYGSFRGVLGPNGAGKATSSPSSPICSHPMPVKSPFWARPSRPMPRRSKGGSTSPSSSLLQIEITKTSAFVFKNWIMAKRNVFTVFEVLFWPVITFLSAGLLAKFAAMDSGLRAFVLVGAVSMSTVQVCQLDVAYVLLYDIWSKAVKHGFMAPVGLRHLFVGSLVAGMVRGGAVFLMLVAASRWLFGFDFTIPGPGPMGLFLGGLFLSAAAVGMLVCILVLPRSGKPRRDRRLVPGEPDAPPVRRLSVLPGWVTSVAQLIPVTYFLEYIRRFYGFEPSFSHALARDMARSSSTCAPRHCS
jgi:ABC-2 type transport system permease protein